MDISSDRYMISKCFPIPQFAFYLSDDYFICSAEGSQFDTVPLAIVLSPMLALCVTVLMLNSYCAAFYIKSQLAISHRTLSSSENQRHRAFQSSASLQVQQYKRSMERTCPNFQVGLHTLEAMLECCPFKHFKCREIYMHSIKYAFQKLYN